MKASLLSLFTLLSLNMPLAFADSASVRLSAQSFSASLDKVASSSCTDDCDEFRYDFQTITLKHITHLEQEIKKSWEETQKQRDEYMKSPEVLAMTGLQINLVRTRYLITEHEKGMARFDLLNIADSVEAMKDLSKLEQISLKLRRVLSASQKLRFTVEEILRKD